MPFADIIWDYLKGLSADELIAINASKRSPDDKKSPNPADGSITINGTVISQTKADEARAEGLNLNLLSRAELDAIEHMLIGGRIIDPDKINTAEPLLEQLENEEFDPDDDNSPDPDDDDDLFTKLAEGKGSGIFADPEQSRASALFDPLKQMKIHERIIAEHDKKLREHGDEKAGEKSCGGILS